MKSMRHSKSKTEILPVHRGKFKVIQAFLQKQEKHQITTYHLKELEKEEQTKPSQQKEVNNKDQRGNKYRLKSNKANSWFLKV